MVCIDSYQLTINDMKILTAGYLVGYNRKKDRSVSLRFETQEKTSQEIAEIDSLMETYGYLYFRSDGISDEEVEELDALETDLYDNKKSQSQRLRNVLFRLCEQENQDMNKEEIRKYFKEFYRVKTEQIIEHFKSKLE